MLNIKRLFRKIVWYSIMLVPATFTSLNEPFLFVTVNVGISLRSVTAKQRNAT